MPEKTLFKFGFGKADGNKDMKDILGGKGANLAEMAGLGLPVPPGVTIPTTVSVSVMQDSQEIESVVKKLTADVMGYVSNDLKNHFGYIPLVSVRSGARVSMPGMMDTILNVGLTTENLPEWVERLGERTAFDSYRRFMQMYGEVVLGIPAKVFEDKLTEIKKYKYGAKALPKTDAELTEQHLMKLIERYFQVYGGLGLVFPDTMEEQLAGAIKAVFESWDSERAIAYRQQYQIPYEWGTAVNVQAMVFGNTGESSGSGVVFTRNPSTGEPELMGEYLANAQGEDVVAGIRTPVSLVFDKESPEMPWLPDLVTVCAKLEKHYRDMQDMEFTVQDGKLWLLQTRNGKRSAKAAFRIAHDLVQDGVITKEEAVKRVTGKQYVSLLRPVIDPAFTTPPHIVGLPAAGAIVSGVAVFSKEAALVSKQPCILLRSETTPDDFAGMAKAVGILTSTGGMTSHAAVVARGMDKTCVVGATNLIISGTKETATVWSDSSDSVPIVEIKTGTLLTMDGITGRVWVGVNVPTVSQGIDSYVRELLSWAKPCNGMVEWVPERGKYDVLPTQGQVVINAEKLGYRKSTKNYMGGLLTALNKRPELTGILSLFGFGQTRVFEHDVKFLQKFFVDIGMKNTDVTNSQKVFLQAMLSQLNAKKWSSKLKKKWVIHTPDWATAEQIALLQGAGWKTVSLIAGLGDLLKVDGYVKLDRQWFTGLTDDGLADFGALVDLLKNAGRTVESLPECISEIRGVFEMLG